jgi:hypothetical protein
VTYVFAGAASASARGGGCTLLAVRPSRVLLLGVRVEGGIREVSFVAVFAAVVTAFDVVLASAPTTHLLEAVFVALKVISFSLAIGL